jgi:hypothetical protein
MEDDKKIEVAETVEPKSRRAFVKGAAKAAVVAPAVVMLLNATTKSANAKSCSYDEPTCDV